MKHVSIIALVLMLLGGCTAPTAPSDCPPEPDSLKHGPALYTLTKPCKP